MKMHDILCESSADRQPEIDEFGIQRWFDDHGKVHREDGPALIYTNGAERWYRHGKLHRIGKPAVIYSDGSEEWYLNGKLHREDGPAIVYPDEIGRASCRERV